MSVPRFVSRWTVAASAAALLAGMPGLALAKSTVAAVWVPRQTQFIYQGFTTHYTCSGLQDEVRHLLRKLGAQDLHVQEMACSSPPGVPSPFPGVRVKMRVLVPASSPQASKHKSVGAPVQAHWQKVVLMPSDSGFDSQGNCELIEQFKESLLPLFSTRNIKYESNCIPYQLTMGTHLSAQVLLPPPKKR
jgi:hypothetical protein